MKEYDLIVIGTGSSMTVVEGYLNKYPNAKVAVIDKDKPGGICLTRGCIPSKILLYPAELLSLIRKSQEFGIDAEIKNIDFKFIMERMRRIINSEIESIRRGLSEHPNIDYYQDKAEFVAPYTLKVGNNIIKSNFIILGIGSRPYIPKIENLEDVGYLTSDTILELDYKPKSIGIIGGGYIAAEYGHFLSSMGCEVKIIGRNPQFLPDEEPEISNVLRKELEERMEIYTNYEVFRVEKEGKLKSIYARNRKNKEIKKFACEEILVAAGRESNADLLNPKAGNIELDDQGWIKVNEYLETSQPNIWALGDADGKFMFKHVANYEAEIVYYNAVERRRIKADYHAIPHAVFTYPEVASVGLKEKETLKKFSKDSIAIGFYKYENTAKGEAMNAKGYFVKVILDTKNMKILGAHIVGPYASILIQEIINLMYVENDHLKYMINSIHIHPALTEVVQRAFFNLFSVEDYHHFLKHFYESI